METNDLAEMEYMCIFYKQYIMSTDESPLDKAFSKKVANSLGVPDIELKENVRSTRPEDNIIEIFRSAVHTVCALDDNQFVSGSDDETLKLWNVQEKKPTELVREYSGHNGYVRAVCVLPKSELQNPQQFVSGSNDDTLKLWNVGEEGDGDVQNAVMTYSGHTGPVNAVCALPKSELQTPQQFVSGSDDKTLKLWNVGEEGDGDVQNAVMTYSGHTNNVNAVCALPKSKLQTPQQFVSGSRDKTLKLWNVGEECDGDVQNAVMTYSGHEWSVDAVCLVNGKQFVSGSDDKTLKLWNVDSPTAVRTFSGHTKNVLAVCALNYTQFVSTSGDDTLRVWNVDSSTADLLIPIKKTVYALDKLNGYQFVSGGHDSTLKLWTYLQPEELPSQEVVDLNPSSNLYRLVDGPLSIVNSYIGNEAGLKHHKAIDKKGGKRRNKKSKKLNKRSIKRKFRKTRRKSRKSRKSRK